LSLMWSLAASVRALRRRKSSVTDVTGGLRIISVGNVAVGGTGKSPVVRALARRALEAGFDVAVLSRGYGRSEASGEDQIVKLHGNEPDYADRLWTVPLSDEGLEHGLLLGQFLRAEQTLWIAQGTDRRRLLDAISARGNLEKSFSQRALVVLLDDGLSQTALPVHHDIVLWDPQSVVTAPRACLPYGPYRIGWPWMLWAGTLPSADCIVWSRLRHDQSEEEFDHYISRARRVLQREQASIEWTAVEKPRLAKAVAVDEDGRFRLEELSNDVLSGEYLVLTGLARPQRFLATLEGLAAAGEALSHRPSAAAIHLDDHAELDSAARGRMLAHGLIVTSLKDLCRWRRDPVVQRKMMELKVCVLCLEVDLKGFTEAGESNSERCLFPAVNKEGVKNEPTGF
jgi:tetraacyldisaccharide 4'-kinase